MKRIIDDGVDDEVEDTQMILNENESTDLRLDSHLNQSVIIDLLWR